MKKIIYAALLLPTMLMSQDATTTKPDDPVTEVKKKPERTISLFQAGSVPNQFGISIETNRGQLKDGKNTTAVFNLSIGSMTLDDDLEYEGAGYVLDSGFRTYTAKGRINGWYGENFFTYGNISFDEPGIFGSQGFKGKYRYISLFNTNVGYKWNIGKFSIDPSVGYNWKWEFKGKGDVDNKYVDNFVLRATLKVGYRF